MNKYEVNGYKKLKKLTRDEMLSAIRNKKLREPDPNRKMCDTCGGELYKFYPTDTSCIGCYDRSHPPANAYDPEKIKRVRLENARILFGCEAVNEMTLDKYKPLKGNGQALEVCKSFNPNSDNLYLWGPCGQGKTHLAIALGLKSFLDNNSVCFSELRKISLEFREGERSAYDKYENSDLLIINDLGHKVTQYELDLLSSLIENRYHKGKNGMIITSNFGTKKLTEISGDARVTSRILQKFKIVNIDTGIDYRTKGQK